MMIFTVLVKEYMNILDFENFEIKYWVYGHIHSNYTDNLVEIPNISTELTSCDYLEFKPVLVK